MGEGAGGTWRLRFSHPAVRRQLRCRPPTAPSLQFAQLLGGDVYLDPSQSIGRNIVGVIIEGDSVLGHLEVFRCGDILGEKPLCGQILVTRSLKLLVELVFDQPQRNLPAPRARWYRQSQRS